jgi:replicative DNA helicase
LSAVFVDHLGLIGDEGKRGGEYERVSLISRRLKELAMRLNVPVVCLAQLNRAVEDRPECVPQLSDLRDSGRIEEDGDVVLMLYRRMYYVTKGAMKSEVDDFIPQTDLHRVKFKLEKNRNGEPGVADMGWNGPSMKFVDVESRRIA